MEERRKTELDIIQADTLRGIIQAVNSINENGGDITSADIVKLEKIDGTYFLMYFR